MDYRVVGGRLRRVRRRRRRRGGRLLVLVLVAGVMLGSLVLLGGQRQASALEEAFRQATAENWAARIVVVDESAEADAYRLSFTLFFIDDRLGEPVERLDAVYPMAPAAGDEVEARRRTFVRAFEMLAQRYGIRLLGVVWPDRADGGPDPAARPEAYLWHFGDIAGHPAATAVEELAIRGLVGGDGDGRFRPDASVTRAELLKLLEGATGASWDRDRLPGDYWGWELVLNAWGAGVFDLDDYPDRAFYPDEPPPRWELAVLTVGAVETARGEPAALGLEPDELLTRLSRRFGDAAEIPPAAREAVYLAAVWGIFEGRRADGFAPHEEVSRGEAAAVAARALAYLE